MVDNVLLSFAKQRVRSQLDGHGIGLHNRDEVFFLANQDVKAVSDYLGAKKFMMGDSVTTVDAAVFGIMACLLWVDTTSPMHKLIINDCTNIQKFCNTVKEEFWPDWDKVVAKKAKPKL